LTKRIQKVIIIQIGISTASEGGACHLGFSTELGKIIVRIKFERLLFVMGMDDEKLKEKNSKVLL
jgi:hypothetical protein